MEGDTLEINADLMEGGEELEINQDWIKVYGGCRWIKKFNEIKVYFVLTKLNPNRELCLVWVFVKIC